MPEIAFIMGKSASGKDKIYKNLIEDESLKLNTVILYTTRPMRAGETDGVEYFFVNDETAVKMQESGRIVELRDIILCMVCGSILQLMTDRLTLTVVTGIWL